MGTIADGNVIEADDVLSSMRTTAEAGEAITIGKACYIKESDGKAYLSDKATAPYFTGIAYAGVDSAADVVLVTKGKFVTTGLVDKEVYYLGSSGAISTTASSIRIGSADGTTDLYIDTGRDNDGATLDQRAIFRQEETQNTDGGTFTKDVWQTRTLNTAQYNGINGCSLATNQVTLPAGTYYINAIAPAYGVSYNQAMWYNITDASAEIIGQSWRAFSTVNTFARVIGVFTITAEKVFELQHQCADTVGTTGFGIACNLTTEVYSSVTLIKIK
jgi:hypothetical protein